MRLYRLFLASLAFALQTTAAPSPHDDFELRQLTEDNFKASIGQGLWLVEHYSPRCAHCRAFAPTWTQLARDKQHLERLSGFHMAQVNCLAQGDLCNANGIKFYPQLMLYSDGKLVEPSYAGDRSYDDLSNYITEHSNNYASQHLLKSPEQQDTVLTSSRPNVDGKVMHVNEEELDALRAKGPVLTEYFAPWCGHCKKLRPTYEKVAEALQGRINVAAVNCDENKSFCRREGVMGYPTIRLLNGEQRTDYTGSRTVEAFRQFALKGLDKPKMETIKFDDFERILANDEAFFLYLQTFDTAVSDVESVKKTLEPFLNIIPAYTSGDPRLYANLSIAKPPPTSVLLAFSNNEKRPIATLAFPTDHLSLQRFVNTHRFPVVSHLNSGNYNALMKSESRAVVVLAAVHSGEAGEKEKAKLMSIAKAWKKGGRPFQQPVWFAWVEGERWGSWLRQSYGIKKSDLPAAVVVDPSNSEYYDTTIEGTKVAFEGHSIFSVLEGFYQHFLVPKRVETTLEWGSRSATMTLINLSNLGADHPFLAFLVVVGGAVTFVFLLQRCMKRDAREGRESTRLD
ncbi:thioredoxin-like protein [Papiliotrema laurentii]|uniref:Thioredoxin-like protein n=1 Tax=Papiliotrema laurentii TaxID=5418 RepID=A0AAD9CRK6_PAPLA|nr:thioredoxin-like protein [Papiliotrema laurentii]